MPKLVSIPRKLSALLIGLTVFCILIVSCNSGGGESPEDVYRTFRKALLDGDKADIWTTLDPSTQAYYRQKFQSLKTMDQKITKYLPPTDQPLARQKSGTVLLDEIQTPKGLFERTFEPNNIDVNEASRIGLDVDAVDVVEPPDGSGARQQMKAKITTQAGQVFWLRRDHRARWKINLLETVDLESAFAWLNANREALEKTLEDRRAETKKRREQIISELFETE